MNSGININASRMMKMTESCFCDSPLSVILSVIVFLNLKKNPFMLLFFLAIL